MTLQRRGRSYSIASRIHVPNDLRPHVGRREIGKSGAWAGTGVTY